MAQRIMTKKSRRAELAAFVAIAVILSLLLNKYVINGLQSTFDFRQMASDFSEKKDDLLKERDAKCAADQVKVELEDGSLCREFVEVKDGETDPWLKIFDTYPRFADGRELIYDLFDQGDVAIADKYLEGVIQIDRYEPITAKPITWEEDPYNKYWRFVFYGLRDTRHLLYAYKQTGDIRYRDKLIEIVESFLDVGTAKPHAWDDNHAVAYRAMALTNVWWKLRETNDLSAELNEKLLKSIKEHGDFLAQEEHYENTYNHGITQAAALLLLGANFSEMDDSGNWLKLAESRLATSIETLVDSDGVLVENSPYYHFYALEKYWELYRYATAYGLELDPKFETGLDKMIAYSSYILQPNLKVPLLGASLDRQVGNDNSFKEIARKSPEFMYVLTQGREGKMPSALNKYYPTAGQVIMRSGWGSKSKFENEFERQTQIVFDVGPYRTEHSDYDALNFSLYSDGRNLITDTGLYTYEQDDELKKYFHGTYGHNTVLVDGKDQSFGAPTPGQFVEGEGFVMHSAQHNLYPKTYHQRSMSLIGHDAVLIIDRMISDNEHDYEQMFHLFSGAQAQIKDGKVEVRNENGGLELTMSQLMADGLTTDLPQGTDGRHKNLCALEYEKTEYCQTAVFKKRAANTFFVTLIKIGDSKDEVSGTVAQGGEIKVRVGSDSYAIRMKDTNADFFQMNKITEEVRSKFALSLEKAGTAWKLTGAGSENFTLGTDAEGKLTISPKTADDGIARADRPYYTADIAGFGSYDSVNGKITLDITGDAAASRYRVYEQEDLLPIIGYHNILADDEPIKNPLLEMHISDFEKQVAYMTDVAGCRWHTFSDIMQNYVLAGVKIPKNACVMTFDDGKKSHFTNGYQTFRKYGAVATFYVIASRPASGSPSYMSTADLNELELNGNEIGSHTVNHINLLNGARNGDDLNRQISDSKQMLEDLGYGVTTFAYPMGEQSQRIVDIAKKSYLAARDTSKDNTWRDRRPATVSFEPDFIWHMSYHKPEKETPEELYEQVWYNNWWQFEEGYRIDRDADSDIKNLSSYDPTSDSFAVVALDDAGDKISNKFMVSRDGRYVIELFGTVSAKNGNDYAAADTVRVRVDESGQWLDKSEGDECSVYNGQYYCFYAATVDLKAGTHELSVEADRDDVMIDKFRMYRSVNASDSYAINISEKVRVSPKLSPNLFVLEVTRKNVWSGIGIIKGSLVGLALISVMSLALFTIKRKR